MVYGVGIYEKGKYQAKIGQNHTKEYLVWRSMISRCYNPNYHNTKAYEKVEVCDDWKYFQSFAEWFYNNYYEFDEALNLDKDFKCFAYDLPKIYSQNNCIFVPQGLNKTITFEHNVTRDYPVGVVPNSKTKFGTRVGGTFNTKEDAYEYYLSKVYERINNYIEKYNGRLREDILQTFKDFIKNDSLREMHKMQKLTMK